jgi:hypothetical protein
MKTLKSLFLPISAMWVLLTSGCIIVQREPSHSSWPKPIVANDFRQFEGVYRNHGLDAKREKELVSGSELFDFLTGEGHQHGDRGKRVEIRSSQDGNSLRVRLLDEQDLEIDSATLQRGAAFAFSDGALVLHGPFSGWRDNSGNWGPNRQYQSDKLRLASTGGLLGHEFQAEFGLLCEFIPTASTCVSSMFWRKLAQ